MKHAVQLNYLVKERRLINNAAFCHELYKMQVISVNWATEFLKVIFFSESVDFLKHMILVTKIWLEIEDVFKFDSLETCKM